MSAVPDSMRRAFEAAGWTEGRQVDVASSVPLHHPAHGVLAELGGLTLAHPAPDICSIEFCHVTERGSDLIAWATALRTDIVSIAEEDDGHSTLYLSGRGQVIGCSNVHPACFLVGRTIVEALDAIGSGKRAQPMLLPDESDLTLYGVTFRQGDDEIIGPADLL